MVMAVGKRLVLCVAFRWALALLGNEATNTPTILASKARNSELV
jgi:hypothetical protein